MYPSNGDMSYSDSRNLEEEQSSDKYGQNAENFKKRQQQKRKGKYFLFTPWYLYSFSKEIK